MHTLHDVNIVLLVSGTTYIRDDDKKFYGDGGVDCDKHNTQMSRSMIQYVIMSMIEIADDIKQPEYQYSEEDRKRIRG